MTDVGTTWFSDSIYTLQRFLRLEQLTDWAYIWIQKYVY